MFCSYTGVHMSAMILISLSWPELAESAAPGHHAACPYDEGREERLDMNEQPLNV